MIPDFSRAIDIPVRFTCQGLSDSGNAIYYVPVSSLDRPAEVRAKIDNYMREILAGNLKLYSRGGRVYDASGSVCSYEVLGTLAIPRELRGMQG